MENPSIEDGDAADSLLFVSSLPWLRYSSLIQPTPEPADSNPRITFGRYGEQEGRTLMPVFSSGQPCPGGWAAHRTVL